MKSNLLPNVDYWVEDFMATDKFKNICEAVKSLRPDINVCFDLDNVDFEPFSKFAFKDRLTTPREDELRNQKIDLHPFYILDYISKNSTGVIYDIGCGFNFFKNFYNVVGIDPINPNADIIGQFDKEFVEKYFNQFDNAVAINSIHFCNVFQIEKRVLSFLSLVKENGYAYVSLNTKRIIEKTISHVEENGLMNKISKDFFPTDSLIKDFSKTVDKIVDKIDDQVLLYENTVNKALDEPLNGNIKLLVKKKKNERI